MPDFLERVKQGIGKGMTTASVRSKEALESSKVNAQIRELQKQRADRIEELGNIYYTMSLKNTFDEARLQSKCKAIGAVDEAIRQKEQDLAGIHARAEEALGRPKPIGVCACGAEFYEKIKFCGKCGAKLPTPT